MHWPTPACESQNSVPALFSPFIGWVASCFRQVYLTTVFVPFQAQFIAQSIGQAFQVAYVEFLKANGIEDSSFVKEMDYQEVLNSQEIFNNELALFSSKERQKEVT